MSCNYADNLSSYENKGILGAPEKFDTDVEVNEKCKTLAQMILQSKHIVVHTGAGISTSAGIPDFRGPKGVWTLQEKGEKPQTDISFENARPTKTHLAIKSLINAGIVKHIISQNIDGLHLKSGISRKFISELHGNMFIENCSKCRRQYIRKSPSPTVGLKPTGNVCPGLKNVRSCRGGFLIDNILDWEDNLPDKDLDIAHMHSTIADLNICLGSTLQINPSGSLPIKNKKYNGKFVICNLQPTKFDKNADLIISTYVDDVMEKIMKRLGIELDEYYIENDPTKECNQNVSTDWTISDNDVKKLKEMYDDKVKRTTKRKINNVLLKDDKYTKLKLEKQE